MDHISGLELAEWEALYGIETFGEVRGDLQAAIIASTIANANRDPKQRAEPFEVSDFMPDFKATGNSKSKGMSGEATLAFMRAMMPPLEKRPRHMPLRAPEAGGTETVKGE